MAFVALKAQLETLRQLNQKITARDEKWRAHLANRVLRAAPIDHTTPLPSSSPLERARRLETRLLSYNDRQAVFQRLKIPKATAISPRDVFTVQDRVHGLETGSSVFFRVVGRAEERMKVFERRLTLAERQLSVLLADLTTAGQKTLSALFFLLLEENTPLAGHSPFARFLEKWAAALELRISLLQSCARAAGVCGARQLLIEDFIGNLPVDGRASFLAYTAEEEMKEIFEGLACLSRQNEDLDDGKSSLTSYTMAQD